METPDPSRREGDIRYVSSLPPIVGATYPWRVMETGPLGGVEIAFFMHRHDAQLFVNIQRYVQEDLIYSVEER